MKKKPTSKPASKAPTQRQLQVGELLRHAVAEVLMEGRIHDEALSVPITVSEARLTPDLRSATVFVMPLGGVADKKGFLKSMTRAAPAIRALVTKKINLRFAPELFFRLDESFDRGSHMEGLLKNVKVASADVTDDEASGEEA